MAFLWPLNSLFCVLAFQMVFFYGNLTISLWIEGILHCYDFLDTFAPLGTLCTARTAPLMKILKSWFKSKLETRDSWSGNRNSLELRRNWEYFWNSRNLSVCQKYFAVCRCKARAERSGQRPLHISVGSFCPYSQSWVCGHILSNSKSLWKR